MEEEYDGLQQSALQAKAQLKSTRVNLEDRKAFCQQLQEECDSMNEQVGGWAERQRCVCVCAYARVRVCMCVCVISVCDYFLTDPTLNCFCNASGECVSGCLVGTQWHY